MFKTINKIFHIFYMSLKFNAYFIPIVHINSDAKLSLKMYDLYLIS